MTRTVSEMCPKEQFYHHKNVWTVSIVKFEFPGYNEKTRWHLSSICRQMLNEDPWPCRK